TGTLGVYQFLGNTLAPLPPGVYPSGIHYWLGTDNIGQDILTWTIYGARIALLVGVLAALSSVLVGTLVGLVAGFYGKLVDTLLMRTADIVLVLPSLPIVIILTTVLGQNVLWIVVVIAILAWPGIARVIRAQTLSLRERPFVDAARISGASNLRIMFFHIAPNILPFTFLYMTLLVAGAILTEAALSFIGLGDAKAISWGQMLNTLSSSGSTTTAWWWLLPPGLAITILSMGFYFVGRAVDEIVNPRLRER
ncbi:MAG TPA: ABC transporter permease, partial [Thermoplasmata archaeon]|nr:ABC transporter permease [Thermoplasmata archaeon]